MQAYSFSSWASPAAFFAGDTSERSGIKAGAHAAVVGRHSTWIAKEVWDTNVPHAAESSGRAGLMLTSG